MSLDLHRIRAIFEKGWDESTCHPDYKDDWHPDTPSLGQCYVTARVLQQYFGGDVVGYQHHFWNILDGKPIDLTWDQFEDWDCEEFEPPSEMVQKARVKHYKAIAPRVRKLLHRIGDELAASLADKKQEATNKWTIQKKRVSRKTRTNNQSTSQQDHGRADRHYLLYWRNETVNELQGHRLNRIGSAQIAKSESGDTFWIVSLEGRNSI